MFKIQARVLKIKRENTFTASKTIDLVIKFQMIGFSKNLENKFLQLPKQ